MIFDQDPEIMVASTGWVKQQIKESIKGSEKSRNWGLVCGFGYGFASATFAFIILLFVTAPHA